MSKTALLGIIEQISQQAKDFGFEGSVFTVGQAAKICNVSPETLWDAFKTGKLSYLHIGKENAKRPSYRVSKDHLADWLYEKNYRKNRRAG